jgi:hypothetical protein
LAKTDIFARQEQTENDEQMKGTNNIQNDNQLSLLNTLKKFNQYFTEDLKLKIQ